MGWIYKLVFPNGKGYVGQTVRERLSDRLRAHKNRAKANTKNHCRALCAAIRKYGWENVKHEVLFNGPVLNDDLDYMETLAIQENNTLSPNGYNLTKGGDVNPIHAEGVRERLSATCSTAEHKAGVSSRIKALHSDPEWKAAWLQSHKESHQRSETRAKIVANNKISWARDGERKRRGDAIRAALNTPAQIALREERKAKVKATKAKKREDMLSKLPPAEREKHKNNLARKRAARQARAERTRIAAAESKNVATVSNCV